MTQTISERLDPQVLLASLDGVEAAFADRNPRSVAMHRRARATLPGGNTRTGISVDPFPIYAESGAGAYLRDLDGHELLDLVNNASALMLGHAHPAVVEALQAQVVHGTAFSQPMAMEVEMAELLQERMPALELLRFCSSGTEAVLNALRAARAHTGRGKIAKFAGVTWGHIGDCYDLGIGNRIIPMHSNRRNSFWRLRDRGRRQFCQACQYQSDCVFLQKHKYKKYIVLITQSSAHSTVLCATRFRPPKYHFHKID